MTCTGIDAITGAAVVVEYDRTITSVAAASQSSGGFIAPGWIDIQVNGYAGVDYNSPRSPHEELARSVHVQYAMGVTRFYPTVITGGPDEMAGALRNLARFKQNAAEGAAMDGFHVEGPYISPEDGPRGAHPKRWVRRPDFNEFQRWQEAAQGHVRLVTISPEWPEAPGFIEKIVKAGVVASIGHTNADAAQIADAVKAGATLSTHLGNGSHSIIRRHPNYIWDQLAEDGLMADFIADGIHLPASFLKACIRAKGLERSVLVTDAAMPAGCKPGRYCLGEQIVELTADGDRVVLEGTDKLAGSALRMDVGVENLMKLAGLSLADAVRMATVNAAKAGRVPGRENGLAKGDRADFVLFDFDPEQKKIEVRATYVDGQKVFSRDA
ncbi:MAG TPA: N-acetylglucosamine-6-phosphate deacetylase [Bryobacteraceae bacterium]|nr:N-acetylglucosamine-6-phosphate deacetylase [Bryobacteraceae bacterium]